MNFVIIMIFMTIMLLTSKAESDRKTGWTIVGIVAFLCLFGKMGPAVFWIAGIVAIVVVLGWIFTSGASSKNNKSEIHNYVETKPVLDEPPNRTIIEDDSNEEPANDNNEPINFKKDIIAEPKKEIRHEEKKIRKNKTPSVVKKKHSKTELETDKENTEKIEITESILTKGLAIGEMQWTHIEKGNEAEEEAPSKEFFASVKEAIDEYSVPDGYIRVMIEKNGDGTITECPALVWKDNFFLNILPMLKKSSVSCWSLKKFKTVTYRIIADVNPDEKYNEIGKQEIINEFEDKLPEYMFDGKHGTYTTAFVFQDGLEITNASAKEMFELLEPEFIVEDDDTEFGEYGAETKENYKKHILWLNGIIDSME